MKAFRTALVVALLLVLLWAGWSFRSGNAGSIDVDLVWFRLPNVAVWWALSVAIGAGIVIGALFVGFAWLRQRILNRRYRKAIAKLEGELQQLRSAALESSGPVAAPPPVRRFSFGQGSGG